MALSLRYSELRARLRNYLSDKQTPLDHARILRYALLQGPWQPWLVRYYQSHGHNPPLPVCPESLFAPLEVEEVIERLNADAYAPGFLVPADEVERIVAYARKVGVKRSDDPHRFCDAACRIACDPQIVDVARRYLETEPILHSSKLYWTVPPAGDREGQAMAAAEGARFHYDLADLKALTVFVYLTDVEADCGPHVVIRGTQRRRSPAQIFKRFLDDDEVKRRYADRLHVVTGSRGTGWFEDICCYHKQAAGEKVRLMLSIIYSLHRPPLADERRLGSAGAKRDGRAITAIAR